MVFLWSPFFFFLHLCVCVHLIMWGNVPLVTVNWLLNDLILSDSDYMSAALNQRVGAELLLSDPKKMWYCLLNKLLERRSSSICRNVRLTVAGSPSEKERGSREEKKGEERGGESRGAGNDLLFSAHENQMFTRTPRHPSFRHAPTPRGPRNPKLFPLYSLTVI